MAYKRKDRKYDEKKDFLLTEKIDHTRIIFRMIDNINRASFGGNDQSFFRGVETLEANIPKDWEDEEYEHDMVGINNKRSDDEIRLGPHKMGDASVQYSYTLAKFRAINNLLERRGTFGERDIEETI